MTAHAVDHTAIAVRDLDTALDRYQRLFGLKPGARGRVPNQGVEVAFLSLGDTQIELIQPIDDQGAVARFLERRGEGLHHIALRVDDLRAELARLRAAGVELIDSEPRPGFHGLVAFVHPRATGGTLIELVQHIEDRFTPY